MEFSESFGFKKGKKTKLAEELNVFKMETPAIQVKDFTEDFSIVSPVSEIISNMKIKKDNDHKYDKNSQR